MKTVLIVTYYWPPAGGGGVQRWVKFVRYLREFGWQPQILVPDNPDYPLVDESLESELPEGLHVIRRPILEPRRLFRKLSGEPAAGAKKGSSMDELFYLEPRHRSWKQNASIWIRGNLFVPDARVTWVRPVTTYLTRYLERNPVDALVTTGPPHSLHLIGLRLKKKLGIRWVADFRDPWTDIEFYDRMMLTKWADNRHRSLSEQVATNADALVIATYYWRDRWPFSMSGNAVVITNGWDQGDFSDPAPPLESQFVVSHMGTLAVDRNPDTLWQALGELCSESEDFARDLRIRLLGKTDPNVVRSASSHGLANHVETTGWMSHADSIAAMRSSQVLLLLINKSERNAPGRMTGKIFEYLAARRPILLIGPEEGDAARVIRQTGSGASVELENLPRIKSQVWKWYQRYRDDTLFLDSTEYMQYSRRNLTRQLAQVLETVTEGR